MLPISAERKVQLPMGSSDAALAPYHVDRSKLFVIERFDAVEDVDAARIARAIEYTRFPYVDTPEAKRTTSPRKKDCCCGRPI